MTKTSSKNIPRNPELDAWQKKAEEYLAGWKRAQADFDNYRKRIEADKTNWTKFVSAESLLRLAPVLEDFRRAFDHVPIDLKTSPWIAGVKQIEQHLRSILVGAGLKPIEDDGLFDPNLHEAIAYEEHPELPDGSIIGVVEIGWQLDDKIIKPAKVRVSKGKK